MEMEPGKLFIGGISWDTNEDRLREYFETFGNVVEAVIMKDRNTGRARGFGFVVYADPSVAERVVREKHIIDGRTVEAKKAVPRDDQNVLTRNSGSSLSGSPGPIRTKKIFVGGLASTVTENDFRSYFDQFGTITDVVVMYDHNTQRPRGFGFITYDSEEAVEKVLLKTFHELNGKMVEVKRAVPKEQSPGPNRNQLGGYKVGMSRVSSLLNAYTQGYNIPSSVGGYGLRVEDRFSPVTVGRSGYSPFGPSGYNIGLNFEPGLSPSYAGSGNFSPTIGSGRALDPFHNNSPRRYNNPMDYAGYGGGGGIGSLSSSTGHSLWGGGISNNVPNSSNPNDFIGSRSGLGGLIGASGSIGTIWGSSKSEDGGVDPAFVRSNINFDNTDNAFGFGRNSGNNTALTSPHAKSSNAFDGLLGNLYGGGSFYGDSTWRSPSPELDGSGSFDYGPGGGLPSDVTVKNSARYVGGYSANNGADRGIVT